MPANAVAAALCFYDKVLADPDFVIWQTVQLFEDIGGDRDDVATASLGLEDIDGFTGARP